jgi:5-methylcytosine-specific restriction protein A
MKPNKISAELSEKYGLPISMRESTETDGGKVFEFWPTEVHPNNGFTIKVRLGWRSIDCSLVLGSFSAPLIENFGIATTQMKESFCLLGEGILRDGAKLSFKVNDLPCDIHDFEKWPTDKWERIEFSYSKSPIVLEEKDQDGINALVFNWGGKMLGCILCLSPLEETEPENGTMLIEGLPEGAVITVKANRYERNRLNRAHCIDFHGARCKACGLDFKNKYGSIGEGFIHVHHITPVSQLGPNYKVNPISDLVPVCPNCHYMLHRSNPPMTVADLIAILNRKEV